MWFESLTGFAEESAEVVRENLTIDGPLMTSAANGRQMRIGRFETPSLAQLRLRCQDHLTMCTDGLGGGLSGGLQLSEIVGDVQQLHCDPANAGALFQVASQFNVLEMVSPTVTPEHGVDIYEDDRTQGPACAIACGAGTIFRNYFVEVDGQVGQSRTRQINCLAELGQALGNVDNAMWQMQNGYIVASLAGLQDVGKRLAETDESQRDALRQLLCIGIHHDTAVTLGDASHTVAQAYCSAVPVAYSNHPPDLWQDFARLILEAAYEATMCTAVLNRKATGCNKVFLTLLGGGAFGNSEDWIFDSLSRALDCFQFEDFDVAIVSYEASNSRVRKLVEARASSNANG